MSPFACVRLVLFLTVLYLLSTPVIAAALPPAAVTAYAEGLDALHDAL